jgi:ParB-like chromosome segregation protein Spo0J
MSEKAATNRVENWALGDIRPYPNNVKKHTPEQVAEVAASIKRFGPDQPIVVDGAGVIIKGHGRLLAAQHLGMKTFPVIVRTDLTAAEANLSRVVDNRVARTEDDAEKLQLELGTILEAGEFSQEDFSGMGFSEKEINFGDMDLGEMDIEQTLENLADATDSQMTKTEQAVADVKVKEVNLHSAFGFKHVPGAYAPAVSQFIALLQAAAGEDGPIALGKFAQAYVNANSR